VVKSGPGEAYNTWRDEVIINPAPSSSKALLTVAETVVEVT
jgi:hypothetical protein